MKKSSIFLSAFAAAFSIVVTGEDALDAAVASNLVERAWATLDKNTISNTAAQWHPLRGVVPSTTHFHGVWNWDGAFHALALARRDAELARHQFRIMMKWQGADGMFPDVVRQDPAKGVFRGNTKPPVWAWAVWTIERTASNAAFLREAYTALVREETFWQTKRFNTATGMFHYDGNSKKTEKRRLYCGWESGWDNSPRWDGAEPWNIIPVDLNSYMVLRYRSLRDIALKLGLTGDAAQWQRKADSLAALVEEKLWDAADECYYDWDVATGDFIRVLTPASFMPLFTLTASSERAGAMARHAKRLEPGWPTVEYAHRAYDPVGYWRGRTWLNTAYFALKGLKFYGYGNIASRGRKTILGWVSADRRAISENYNSLTGEAAGWPDFGWSAAFTIKFIDDWHLPPDAELPENGKQGTVKGES